MGAPGLKCYGGWILAALLIVLAGLQALQASDAIAKAEAADNAAQVARKQAQTARTRLAMIEATYARDSARWAERSDSLKTEIELARQTEADEAGNEARAASGLEANLRTLRRTAPSHLIPLVDSALVAHERRERADDRQEDAAARLRQGLEIRITILEADTFALRSRIRGRDERIRTLEAALDAERSARDAWQEAADPGFFAGLWQSKETIVVSAATGAALCLAFCRR